MSRSNFDLATVTGAEDYRPSGWDFFGEDSSGGYLTFGTPYPVGDMITNGGTVIMRALIRSAGGAEVTGGLGNFLAHDFVGGSRGWAMLCRTIPASGTNAIQVSVGYTTTNAFAQTADNALRIGEWATYAFVHRKTAYRNKQTDVYVNGVEQSLVNDIAGVGTSGAVTADIGVGNLPGRTRTFDGIISHIVFESSLLHESRLSRWHRTLMRDDAGEGYRWWNRGKRKKGGKPPGGGGGGGVGDVGSVSRLALLGVG